ncbi:MAG: four helix bundle protein [Bacteroidota bacterium]
MKNKYLQLNDVSAYKTAFHLSNYVWEIVVKWDWFAKKHVGGQFVEAVDSISANIAEGFGRYHKKDKIKFYRYSQGSLKESFDWNEKSKVRKLLNDEQYHHILRELQKLPKEINQQINLTNKKLTI